MTSHSFSDQPHDIEEVSREIDGSSNLLIFVEDDYFSDIFAMDDVTRNKNGLEKLLETTATVKTRSGNTLDQRRDIAFTIIYGGKENSKEGRLRSRIRDFVCAKLDENNLNYDSSSFFFDHESYETSDSSKTFDGQSKETTSMNSSSINEGQSLQDDLARLSLKFIATCLSKICECRSLATKEKDATIDFRDPFWVQIVGAIIDIIETEAYDDGGDVGDEVIELSLHCLRLLCSLEPVIIEQLLQQSLLPYLIHLKECSATQNLPSIQSESSLLLKSAGIF